MFKSGDLPIIRQPFQNELITSWLDRVASVYGLSWSRLSNEIGDRAQSIGDYKATPRQISFLAKMTRMEKGVIRALDLARKFPGQQVERFQCHPDTKLSAPDFCLECFHDDFSCGRDNYFRHEWAIAGVSHCHIHGTLLRSTCVICNEASSLAMMISNGRVQVYCKACGEAIRRSKNVWHSPSYVLRDNIIAFETRIFRSLNSLKPRRKIPFQTIDDIAFLYFCADLPKSASACKKLLFGWSDGACRASKLTRPLRENWLFDGAYLNPLGTVDASYRCALIEASIAIFENITEGVRFWGRRNTYREASLQGLFEALNDAGREELVSRANGWPKYLREQVRGIVNAPRSTSEFSRYYLRQGWFVSDARLAVNRGEMPKYSHF